MKKIIYIILLLISIFIYQDVSASNVKETEIPNYFYTRYRNYTTYYFSYKTYDVNNNVAYCIEPDVSLTKDTYYSTDDFYLSGLNSSQINKINLISHYGYGYNNHNTMDHRVATQELIWEELTDFEFNFSTEYLNKGSIINLEDEKSSIMNYVNNHYVKPSFDNATITLVENETKDITDNNNVLSNFDISNLNISNNKISLKYDNTGVYNYTFSKWNTKNTPIMLHHNGDSQLMITSGRLDDVSFNLRVNVVNTNLSLKKTGEEFVVEDGTYKYETKNLDGVEFSLYANDDIYENSKILYEKDDLVESFTTDKNGHLNINNLLFGKYYIKEEKVSDDYVLDNNKYYFEIDKDNLKHELKLDNKLKKGNIEFKKVDLLTGLPLEGVEIEFYDESDNLFYKGTTDKNGLINIENIKIGKYYVKETKALDGYILNDEKLYFDISYDETTNLVMTNNKLIEIPDTLSEFNIKAIIFFIVFVSSIIISIKYRKYFNKNKKLFLLLLLIVYTMLCYFTLEINANSKTSTIHNLNKGYENIVYNNIVKEESIEKPIMTLKIPRINLNNNIFDKTSKLNNVDVNLEINNESSMPDELHGTLIIAGHSGTNKYAYFNDLIKLKINDEATISYNDELFTYYLHNVYEIDKNGYLNIEKEYMDTNLVLVTCSDNNKQNIYVFEKKVYSI